MSFWGIIVEPGKPFTHSFDKVRRRLHLSQATLGVGESEERIIVQCKVGKKTPILLCSLKMHKNESCLLDIEFKEEDGDVVFEVTGVQSVHLIGFYPGNGSSREGEVKMKNSKSQETEDQEEEGKGSQVRTLDSGLVIENLEVVNCPNSPIAIPGSEVSVYLVAKLKSDGFIFGANIGKSPYKCKLGEGKHVKGFEVGVNGMRVGDKRRITIPPFMGYTVERKDVPANAWLVFDVEVCQLE